MGARHRRLPSSSTGRPWQRQQDPLAVTRQSQRQSAKTYVVGGDGDCEVSSFLNASYVGDRASSGTMFTLTAKQDIEVLTFEFAHFEEDVDGQDVEVYVKTGPNFLEAVGDRTQWQEMAQTTAYLSPEMIGASVVPRADVRSVKMFAGQQLSFYITLKEIRMKMSVTELDSGLSTGDPYLADEFLEVSVGVGLRDYPFPDFSDIDRVFHGAIYYQAIQSCSKFESLEDVIVMVFAVDDLEADASGLIEALSDSITTYIHEYVELRRMEASHGLVLDAITDKNLGGASGEDCGDEANFQEGCILFEVTTVWKHYQSLSNKELTLHLLKAFTDNKENVAVLNGRSTIAYVGNQVLEQYFMMKMSGVPVGTLLNPIQRRYASDVTLRFLETFLEDKTVYGVEVETQTSVAERRMLPSLRTTMEGGIDAQHLQRDLQAVATLETKVIIYGVDHPDNSESLFNAVEATFAQNQRRYLRELSRGHLRPGVINDGVDLGGVFHGLLGVQMSIEGLSNVTDVGTYESDTSDENNIGVKWIYIWAGVFTFSMTWLAFRIARDYCLVPEEARLQKKERLSERKARLKEQQRIRKEKRTKKRAERKERRSSIGEKRRPFGIRRSRRHGEGKAAGSFVSGKDKIDATPLKVDHVSVSAVRWPSDPTAQNIAGEKGRGIAPSNSMPISMGRESLEVLDLASESVAKGGKKPLSCSSQVSSDSTPRNRSREMGGVVEAGVSMPGKARGSSAQPVYHAGSGENRGLKPSTSIGSTSSDSTERRDSRHSQESGPRTTRTSHSRPTERHAEVQGGSSGILRLDRASPARPPRPLVNKSGERGRAVAASKSLPIGGQPMLSPAVSSSEQSWGERGVSPKRQNSFDRPHCEHVAPSGIPVKKKTKGVGAPKDVARKKKKSDRGPRLDIAGNSKTTCKARKKHPSKSRTANT